MLFVVSWLARVYYARVRLGFGVSGSLVSRMAQVAGTTDALLIGRRCVVTKEKAKSMLRFAIEGRINCSVIVVLSCSGLVVCHLVVTP